jgi:predicted kinase
MKVIILSGVSGSGKSTLAAKLSAENGGAPIFSADSYFMKEGVYCFDPTKIGEAHKQCLRSFAWELNFQNDNWFQSRGLVGETIIVDNTNTTALELAPYVALAQAYGYKVEIHTILVASPLDLENPWKEASELQIAWNRSIHGMPAAGMLVMARNIDARNFPPYWTEEFGVSFVWHDFDNQ